MTGFDPTWAEELRLAHNTAFTDYPDGSPMGADFRQTYRQDFHHLEE